MAANAVRRLTGNETCILLWPLLQLRHTANKHEIKHMSRSEYQANKEMAVVTTDTKAVKDAPAGYITGPVIRSESEKPAVKLGDVNDSSTWGIV